MKLKFNFAPQTALPDQEGPSEGTCNELEMFSTRELAYYITLIDWDLFCSLHEVSDRVDQCASAYGPPLALVS